MWSLYVETLCTRWKQFKQKNKWEIHLRFLLGTSWVLVWLKLWRTKKFTSSVIDFLLSAQISQGRKATVLQNSSVECKIKVFRSFFMPKIWRCPKLDFFLFLFYFFFTKKAHKFSRYRDGTFYVYMNLCTHRESWESINCAKKYTFSIYAAISNGKKLYVCKFPIKTVN